MIYKTTTIKVTPGSELDQILEQAGEKSILLERDGTRYQVTRLDREDYWDDYDPEAAATAIRSVAGTLSDAEAKRFKEFVYRAREEGTRPPGRP